MFLDVCEKCAESILTTVLYSALKGFCSQCSSIFKKRAFNTICNRGISQSCALLIDLVVPVEIKSLTVGASGYDEKVFKEQINGKVFFIITIPHMKV